MGGTVGGFVSNTWETAKKTVADSPKKVGNYLEDISHDPARVATAAATLGASEVLRETGVAGMQKLEEEAARNAPKPPELPKMPEPGKGDGEAPKEYRPGRGRASTILSGSQGVGGRAATARRTLLGV
jgi:hypothetical protein